jgi:uncharacterized protein YyaL (SSP411 family)
VFNKVLALSLSVLLGSYVFIEFSPVNATTTINKPGNSINWQPWSEDIFSRAQAEKKLIILDLHAVWCHWCHVMDEKTYSDPQIIDTINKYFIPVSVDQDSRPDLAARYQDYGWPATVIFNSQGKEREILSGYYSPKEFLPILKDCVKLPNNLATKHEHLQLKYSADNALSPNLKEELMKRNKLAYDTENGGWSNGHKFLPADSVEYSMVLAHNGDSEAARRAKEVLNLQNNLLDPVWGGMYQYSTDNDWKHPHFEKIMSVQADNLRIYSLGYLLFQDQVYLNTAQKIYQYLNDFLLSPEGAFYTSQDADLIPGKHSQEYFTLDNNARRKLGIPKVDKHIYSRENGWVIEALTYLYSATGDQKYLDAAIKAAEWIIANRADGDGFAHENPSQPYLSDNLSIGRAFLALYATSGDRAWLKKAESVANFIGKTFALPTGFATAKAGGADDVINLDENVLATRFFNCLYHYTGENKYQDWALVAMHYLSTPAVSENLHRLVCGLLLADQEVTNDPFHIIVVGEKNNAQAKKLFEACQKYPLVYRQIEWLDTQEGSLPGQTVEYPQLGKPAAFTCSNSTCSSPAYTVESVNKILNKTKSAEQK